MKNPPSTKLAASVLSIAIIVLFFICLLAILLPEHIPHNSRGAVAEIYQSGELLYALPLEEITERQTLTITAGEEACNVLEICPEGIRVLSASCPDKLCMRQGWLATSGLPIVCLPNELVIRITFPDAAPDAVTY